MVDGLWVCGWLDDGGEVERLWMMGCVERLCRFLGWVVGMWVVG